MKKWLFVLAIVALLVPGLVLAMDVRAGDKLVIAKDEVIKDDLYFVGESLTINGRIEGSVITAASQIRIDGTIQGDLVAGASIISIDGSVGDDVYLAAGQVMIEGFVGDDLFIGAGTVDMSEESEVAGDTAIGAGQLVLAGITGEVKSSIGELDVQETAVVKGDLTYSSEEEAAIDKAANITGDTTFNQIQPKPAAARAFLSFNRMMSLLTTLVIALLAVYIKKSFVMSAVESWKKKFGINLLWGILAVIVIPVAAIILMITLALSPLGVGLMLIYPIILYAAKIIGIIGLGFCIQGLWDKKLSVPGWQAVIIGALGYYILALIPVIGPLGTLIISLVGIGVVVTMIKEHKSCCPGTKK